MNPLEIVARTPKSNCGECGFPACLAFAAAVCATGIDLRKCPYIDLEGLAVKAAGVALEDAARQRDLVVVAHLKGKIAEVDFTSLAPRLGAELESGTLLFSYLGQQVALSKETILIDGAEPEDPRDRILLYNYVFSGGGRRPDGEWIGMESMPNSISKVRTLATYCEEPIAGLFGGREIAEVTAGAGRAGGKPFPDASASLDLLFAVLPRLPQRVLFWAEEPEDGFPAKAKVLYDHHALDYLDIESLLFSSERLAERLAVLLLNP
ncbi:MAG: DUF3786 domain-containing protein [Desulfobulbales bacterium]|nr:DUF3786 domain-containing protein [Desulfobulbales bacterium]